MKPVLFLRIASVLTLIHSVMHTAGGVFGKPVPGIAAATVSVMKTNQFQVFGVLRSYFDFYRGLGLGITILLTAEAVVFWQLGNLAKSDAARLRPVLCTFLLAYLVLAWNSYTYIFFGPVIAEVLIALCVGMAMVTAKVAAPGRTGELAANRA